MRNWINRLRSRRITTRCFIVGAPRSGTTLIQARLARHPRLVSFAETHLYSRADGIGSRPEVQVGRPGPDVYRDELRAVITSICKAHDLDPAALTRLLHGRRIARLKASFFQCLDEIALRKSCRGWIEKTPAHVRYIGAIKRDLPDATFIHVLREGIPVVASLFDVTRRYPRGWGGEPWPLERCIDTWNRDIQASLEYRRKPNHVLMRYESFVEKTDHYRHVLWWFLGADPADYRGESSATPVAAIVQPFEHWKKEATGPIQRDRNDRASELLSPAQIEQAKVRLKYAGRVPAAMFE